MLEIRITSDFSIGRRIVNANLISIVGFLSLILAIRVIAGIRKFSFDTRGEPLLVGNLHMERRFRNAISPAF
jgi:hypothetical protein